MANSSSVATETRRFARDEQPWIWRILTSMMWALILITAVEVVLWVWASEDSRSSMREALFGALLNLALVAIIGGGVAALCKWIEREVEASRMRAAGRIQFLARLGDAYRSVKGVRRMLRADGVIGNVFNQNPELSPIEVERYDHHMARVNDAQLELEALRDEAWALPDIATISGLDSHLRAMERYLGDLISEYERFRPSKPIKRSDLKCLNAFADPLDKSDFRSRFVAPHNAVRVLISQRL